MLVNTVLLFINSLGYSVYKVTASVSGGPSMAPGDTYWLTISNATDAASDGTQAWDINGGPATCNYRQSGTNLGECTSGTAIVAEHTTPQGGDGEAFTISGSQATTPEPGSIMLFGSGILGIAGVLRRKLMG